MPELNIDGAKLYYHDSGTGTPVVMLHSSASSSRQWLRFSQALENEFHIIAPDLYGYGRSQNWPSDERLTLDDEAEIVRRLLAGIDGPFHLVGHSYGGAVAMKLALDMPERLKSLTLIEPVSFFLLDKGRELEEIGKISRAVVQHFEKGDYDAAMGGFVDYWNGPGTWASIRPETRKDLASRTPRLASDFYALLDEPATLEAFRELKVPTLILCGEHTREPTRKLTHLLENTLPDSAHMTIAEAGHMSPLTHTDKVVPLIVSHIRQHEKSTPAPARKPAF